MERARTGPFALVVPALVVLPIAALALWYGAGRWFQADARAALDRRLGDVAAAVERQLDAAVQRQAAATRTLATSPTTWLWVKFQGERLTVSNRAHAQAALASLTSFSGLVPSTTLYLASERTRTVYQDGAAVEALSRGGPKDAWYAAALSTEGVVVSDDLRSLRTSMRVMNGPDLLGAVSCVSGVTALAAAAFSAAEDEPGFTFVLADGQGAIVLAKGPRASAAATVFDLFDPGERQRVSAALSPAARPGELSLADFSAGGRRVLAASTVTAAPGWRVVVSADVPGLPVARTLLIAGGALLALLLVGGAILLIASSRARQVEALVDSLQEERDASRDRARDLGSSVMRVHDAAARLGERCTALASEAAAARAGSAEALEALGEAEARSGELRSGIAARLPLLADVVSGARAAADRSREARAAAEALRSAAAAFASTPQAGAEPAAGSTGAGASAAGGAAAAAAAAEEEINVVLTQGSAVTLALDTAGKGAGAVAEAAERARLAALNAALVASRPSAGRQGVAQAADEMRRISEESAAVARSLAGALDEARAGMRAVSRAAQEAGRRAHEAAAAGAAGAGAAGRPEVRSQAAAGGVDAGAGAEPALADFAGRYRALEESLQGLEEMLGKVESAAAGAQVLKGEAVSADRLRSAAEGTARIMERVQALCGEVSAAASTVSRESSRAAARAAGTGG